MHVYLSVKYELYSTCRQTSLSMSSTISLLIEIEPGESCVQVKDKVITEVV